MHDDMWFILTQYQHWTDRLMDRIDKAISHCACIACRCVITTLVVLIKIWPKQKEMMMMILLSCSDAERSDGEVKCVHWCQNEAQTEHQGVSISLFYTILLLIGRCGSCGSLSRCSVTYQCWTCRWTQNNLPRAGSGVVRIDPLCFLAGCHTRRLNQV